MNLKPIYTNTCTTGWQLSCNPSGNRIKSSQEENYGHLKLEIFHEGFVVFCNIHLTCKVFSIDEFYLEVVNTEIILMTQ